MDFRCLRFGQSVVCIACPQSITSAFTNTTRTTFSLVRTCQRAVRFHQHGHSRRSFVLRFFESTTVHDKRTIIDGDGGFSNVCTYDDFAFASWCITKNAALVKRSQRTVQWLLFGAVVLTKHIALSLASMYQPRSARPV